MGHNPNYLHVTNIQIYAYSVHVGIFRNTTTQMGQYNSKLSCSTTFSVYLHHKIFYNPIHQAQREVIR